MSSILNLSNIDLLEKSLSRASLNNFTEIERIEGDFAWIQNVPETLEFSVNISKIYSKASSNSNVERILKIKLWLEIEGICLHIPVTKIFKRVGDFDGSVAVWQMENFDELISMKVPICKLNDFEIELICEISSIDGKSRKGSIKIYNDSKTLRSGLNLLIIKPENNNNNNNNNFYNSENEINQLVKLEKSLYCRKSKEVPSWQVQLMKNRLGTLQEEFCERNSELFVLNLIFPIPSHPLKLKLNFENDKQFFDVCMKDVNESQQESILKRKYPKLFMGLSGSNISNGDLRALHGILQRGIVFEGIAADISNLLWTHREYLRNKFPRALVPFVQSVQWWLVTSDRPEIDEALRIIDGWRIPIDEMQRMEVAVMLLVAMTTLQGLIDSHVWIKVFEGLLFSGNNKKAFGRKFTSALIEFLKSKETEPLKGLRKFLKEKVLFSEDDVEFASQLYWRLKTTTTTGNDNNLFEGYLKVVDPKFIVEFKKQERLFEAIEKVLDEAQRLKGSRTIKLEALKASLSDPEKGVPSAAQQCPLLPGLQRGRGVINNQRKNGVMFNRVRAVVSERSNLFKSTSFTVLLVFMRVTEEEHDDNIDGNYDDNTNNDDDIDNHDNTVDNIDNIDNHDNTVDAIDIIDNQPLSLSLPIIFKKGDDLRRDEGCLRMFRLIWDLWLDEGSLKLFPRHLLYGVVTLGKEFGMVEFVESVPMSRIVELEGEEYDDGNDDNNREYSIARYLKSLPDPFSVSNFLPSCVGFSLLTYLLGIGDRHLDNLLLTPQGHLLHIDFSFVFGDDPKPFAPPVKITREMIRGMEGCTTSQYQYQYQYQDQDQDNGDCSWEEFKGICFTALTILRKKSDLLLSILQSEFPSFKSLDHSTTSTPNPSPAVNPVHFLQDRLGVLVSQGEALQKFDGLLEESRKAMFPQILETIHKWAQYWKT